MISKLSHQTQILGLILIVIFLGYSGCSSSTNSISLQPSFEKVESEYLAMPSIIAFDGETATGVIGGYDLTISANCKTAVLVPMRSASLGESYVVNGKCYFTMTPCSDCLKINSISIDSDSNIVLGMLIKHPFSKGVLSQPPSARNRLDLDIFDVALVAVPVTATKLNFPLIGTTTYPPILVNADGYTRELSNVISDPSAMPYKTCYESMANNRFEMGTDYRAFDLILNTGSTFEFKLYLTMGYGASAKKAQRLNPTYYVPEFNRKAAWKIVVEQPDPAVWRVDQENTLTINIYDWNHGATVATTYPDPAHTDQISAESDIQSVTIEVPGVSNQIITATTIDTTTNGWDDPITYTADFNNEMGCGYGSYTGLVKVLDSRIPGISVVGGEMDTLVSSRDGIILEWFEMIEYATYQTFNIDVSSLYWVKTWDGNEEERCWSSVATDNSRNIYNSGQFKGKVDFNPGGVPDIHEATSGSQYGDIFLCKYTSDGSFCWAETWGGAVRQQSTNVATDNLGNAYITGFFEGLVDFDPGLGEDWHGPPVGVNGDAFLSKFDTNGNYIKTITWNGSDNNNDVGYGLKVNDLDGSCVYVTGFMHQSSAKAFLRKYDPNLNLLWSLLWGPDTGPLKVANCTSVNTYGSNDVYCAGWFTDSTDFDPELPDVRPPFHSGSADAFLCRYDKDGNFIWVRTWGSDGPYGEDCAVSLPIDQSGNIYLGGSFCGTVDFDPGPGVTEYTCNGLRDSFISSFDSDGKFRWAGAWGGASLEDWVQRLDVNSQNEIYVIGFCNGTIDFDPGSGVDSRSIWYGNYISKFTSDGLYLKALTTWDISGYMLFPAIMVDNQDNVIYSGTYTSMDFDFGPFEDYRTSKVGRDICLVKFCY